MLGLFTKQPPLPETSIEWLFDAFEWSLVNFGSDVFFDETQLVSPSDKDFPAAENGVESVAQSILDRVTQHAGVAYWPCRAVDHNIADGATDTAQSIRQVLQALPGQNQTAFEQQIQNAPALQLFYEPLQARNPQVMIAHYAHGIAHHLGHLATTPPPCDNEQWPHMAEALAIYLGFGVIMANTANPTLKGGCGGCQPSALDRRGFLSQYEASYALAIFCVLKDITVKEASQYLKSDLKAFFKKAYRDASERSEMIERLKNIRSAARFRGKTITRQFLPAMASENTADR